MTSQKDKVYKFLNPSGIQKTIDTFPLAPRLDTLDGKEIHMSACGEPDMWIALERRLKNDYPDVNWTVKRAYNYNPVELTDEEMKTCQGMILGVAW